MACVKATAAETGKASAEKRATELEVKNRELTMENASRIAAQLKAEKSVAILEECQALAKKRVKKLDMQNVQLTMEISLRFAAQRKAEESAVRLKAEAEACKSLCKSLNDQRVALLKHDLEFASEKVSVYCLFGRP